MCRFNQKAQFTTLKTLTVTAIFVLVPLMHFTLDLYPKTSIRSVHLSSPDEKKKSTRVVAEICNTKLPMDTNNNSLVTGEAAVLFHNRAYYLYTNDWGACPDVDCCTFPKSRGCHDCCFHHIVGDCVYATGHQVHVYKTLDFNTWYDLGIALSKDAYVPGVMFRPHVVYNKMSQKFIMWYEDRWINGRNSGYAVAVSSSPEGPFETMSNTVQMVTKHKIGDFDIFIDDETDIAYHVRTGVVVEQLDSEYTGVVQASGSQSLVTDNKHVEGPVMFKRGQVYYVLLSEGCCACKGGSNILVYTSDKPLGKYTFRGDVGSNTTHGHVFERYSPYNYITRAQASDVVTIAGDTSENGHFLWLGNAWATSTEKGRPRNKDLLYWTVLNFDQDGKIQQLVRNDTIQVYLQV